MSQRTPGIAKIRSPSIPPKKELRIINTNPENVHAQMTCKVYGTSSHSFRFDRDDFIVISRKNSILSNRKALDFIEVVEESDLSEPAAPIEDKKNQTAEKAKAFMTAVYEKAIERYKEIAFKPQEELSAPINNTSLERIDEKSSLKSLKNSSAQILLRKETKPLQIPKKTKNRKFDEELQRLTQISTSRNAITKRKANLTISSPKAFFEEKVEPALVHPDLIPAARSTQELLMSFENELDRLKAITTSGHIEDSLERLTSCYVLTLAITFIIDCTEAEVGKIRAGGKRI